MRKLWALCLVAMVGLAGVRLHASEGFDDIAKLAKSGIAEEVLVAFIQASPVAYDLTVDEILYLNDLGVSSKTITEVVNHGKDIRAGKEPIVAPIAADPDALKPLDETPDLLVENDFTNVNQPFGPEQPNNNPGILASPFNAYEAPEIVREKEIVRETVYIPTTVYAPPPENCTLSHFYETLTPYGTWVNINDSWCWQPSVCGTDPTWRPYVHRGHWVWTDCGWCWQSDYSWGWAPFHYGRWHQASGYGWLWTPDTTWGPAWVNWRECDSHWGWAPLPPRAHFDVNLGFSFGHRHGGGGINIGFGGSHGGVGFDFGLGFGDYCFVPHDRFCDTGLHNYYLRDRRQLDGIYGRSTVINNNIVINKTTNNIFVNGPQFANVQKATPKQLKQLRIADQNIAAGQALTGTAREDKDRGELKLYRPKVQNIATATPVAIAAAQLAKSQANIVKPKNEQALAAALKAEELRERHLATVDARKETIKTKQEARMEDFAEKKAEFEQKKLATSLQQEQNQQKRAEMQAQLAAEQQKAAEARKQKLELEKQAAEQKKMADQLARERDRVAREQANAETARVASENKARLAAERAAREKAERDAAQRAKLAMDEQRAKAGNKQPQGNDAEGARIAAENERRARLEAERQAREANARATAERMAQQKAQLEAERVARQKALQDAAARAQAERAAKSAAQDAAEQQRKAQAEAERAARLKAQQDNAQRNQIERQQEAQRQAQLEAQREAARLKAQQDNAQRNQIERQQDAARQAQLEAQREAARQKAQADAQARAAERAAAAEAARAAREAARTPRIPVPDPNDPNDPNNPKNKKNRN